MNKSLRRIFVAIVTMFAILGLSTTYFMIVKAPVLQGDPRNTRALYHEYNVYRGAILTSDNAIMAQSVKTDDAFNYQRVYPAGALYAPITGYFSITNRADRGLEAAENTLLNGESRSLWWNRVVSSFTNGTNMQGASIETSINSKLQTLAYQLLGNHDGAIVAMEPSTGRILAMVSKPSYDPNLLATHNTAEAVKTYKALTNGANSPLINRVTHQLYPPGSTFKTVVAATEFEHSNTTPDTEVSAPKEWTLPGTATQLPNSEPWLFQPNGTMTLDHAFAVSSNTAFAQLGVKLGDKAINDTATKLGFGSRITIDGTKETGIPMTATASYFPTGQTPDKLALASIGQGDVTETPLQNVMISAAVANGGKLMKPTLVDRVRASDLSIISTTTPQELSEPFSAATAQKINTMMQSVIKVTYPFVAIPGVPIAAKTGTAQIGIDGNRQDAWITGFAPADNPKIAISVLVHNITLTGGEVASPIFKRLIQEAMNEAH